MEGDQEAASSRTKAKTSRSEAKKEATQRRNIYNWGL
jgi:hypothetical protein